MAWRARLVLVWFIGGLTPQQQPGSYQGGEMMMKSVFWWRKPEYPEETTDLRQVTDETFHTYSLCPVRGLNLGRSGVKQSELRRDGSGALAHRATAVRQQVKILHLLFLNTETLCDCDSVMTWAIESVTAQIVGYVGTLCVSFTCDSLVFTCSLLLVVLQCLKDRAFDSADCLHSFLIMPPARSVVEC